MDRFALFSIIFTLFLGHASFGGEWQDLQRKAEEAETKAKAALSHGKMGKLDLSTPKTPYYLQMNSNGPQKPHVLAVKEYDGTEGTEIKVGGEQVEEAHNAASAIMEKLKQDAHVNEDKGALRENFNLKQAYYKVSTSSSNKLSAGVLPEGGKGVKIQIQWKGFRPPEAASSGSEK